MVARNEEYVDTKSRTLDSIFTEIQLDKIDWLLIDVEGAENKVLKGALKTLQITNNIIVEAHNDENVKFVTSLLQENNFSTSMTSESYSVPHIFGKKQHLGKDIAN